MGGDPALAPEARPVEDLSAPPPPAALPGAGQDWSKGPPTIKFYMYRASSSSSFPLSNVNTGDLAGVMWYLHNEIVGSPHRKYGIDRIRRYKMTFRPVVEFWNVHHSNFAPFFAFDAAQCTSDDCEKIYSKYGFLSGCQPVTPGRSAYQSEANSLIPERCNEPAPARAGGRKESERRPCAHAAMATICCVPSSPCGRLGGAVGKDAADCRLTATSEACQEPKELVQQALEALPASMSPGQCRQARAHVGPIDPARPRAGLVRSGSAALTIRCGPTIARRLLCASWRGRSG
ncbi:unnamed protein product [Prorocentrum cordatum]|uniref:Uncharacterized protein n=1 Tax=Prorocentrum cordatum TaxID=2364126 RepID=A0ABN9PN38_9DINO|nr:unnamed protein product [Polarella glacialis]